MKTFIGQKEQLRREIAELEREINSLYDRIDHDERLITEKRELLDIIGKG